jgi:hypothetical protein
VQIAAYRRSFSLYCTVSVAIPTSWAIWPIPLPQVKSPWSILLSDKSPAMVAASRRLYRTRIPLSACPKERPLRHPAVVPFSSCPARLWPQLDSALQFVEFDISTRECRRLEASTLISYNVCMWQWHAGLPNTRTPGARVLPLWASRGCSGLFLAAAAGEKMWAGTGRRAGIRAARLDSVQAR